MRTLLATTILATLTPACLDDTEVGTAADDVIIGTNDFQDVENYLPKAGSPFGPHFVQYYKGGVGRLVGNTGYCSGTLIGRDLFLTAAHCSHDGTVDFNYEYQYVDGTNTSTIAADTYTIISVVECGMQSLCGSLYSLRSTDLSHQRDFQVLRLAPKAGAYPGDVWGWRLLGTSDPALLASQSAPIALIQHPSALPKKVDTGTATTWDGFNLNHNADSLPGSSGSGVLDIAGRIIMLNDQEGAASNYGPAMRDVVEFSTALKGPLTGNTYQLVHDADGACLDVPGFNKSPGSAIATNACKTSGYYANQEVEIVPSGPAYAIVGHDSRLCLDPGSAATGTLVTQATCAGSTEQLWDVVQTGSDGTAPQFLVHAHIDPTKCLYPDASTWLRVGACSSAANWVFRTTSRSYQVVLDSTSQCLDMTGYSTANGTVPQLYTCKTDSTDRFNQEWQLVPAAGGAVSIVNAFSQKCLEIAGGSTADGALVEQAACTGAANQRFSVIAEASNRFTFKNLGSAKCLDDYSGALRQRTCESSPTTQDFRLAKGVN